MYARGEELKSEFLDNPIVAQQVNKLWTEIETPGSMPMPIAYTDQMSAGLEQALDHAWTTDGETTERFTPR